MFGAGLILTLAGFPGGAEQGQVSPEALTRPGITAPLIVLALMLVSTLLLMPFPITRAVHEDNLRRLAEQEIGEAKRQDVP